MTPAVFGFEPDRPVAVPPVRRAQELRPVAVTNPVPGRLVVDLGQTINGWVLLRRLGPAGTQLTLPAGADGGRSPVL